VVRLWQIPKSSVTGATITAQLVIDELVAQLSTTDITATTHGSSSLLLSRSGSFWANQSDFEGELRISDAGDRIGVQLLGEKDRTKAAAGVSLSICFGWLVCPPLLFCLPIEAAMEVNYVERSVGSIIENLCGRLGTTVLTS
jgi:hypothetical protein